MNVFFSPSEDSHGSGSWKRPHTHSALSERRWQFRCKCTGNRIMLTWVWSSLIPMPLQRWCYIGSEVICCKIENEVVSPQAQKWYNKCYQLSSHYLVWIGYLPCHWMWCCVWAVVQSDTKLRTFSVSNISLSSLVYSEYRVIVISPTCRSCMTLLAQKETRTQRKKQV